EAADVHRGVALYDGSIGNQAYGGGVHLLSVGAVARRISTQDQRPLRLGIDLSVGTVQRAHQQHSTLKALGITNRGYGDIQFGARAREWRQGRGDKDGRYVLYDNC